MTKQIVDQIIYEGERHLPLSISGKGLPHPRDFGLNPFTISTACWRGFYCQYTVRDNRLWLTHLVVRDITEYPPISGVHALYEENRFLEDDEVEPEHLLGRGVGKIVGSPDRSKIGRRELHYDGGIYTSLNVFAPLTGGILLGIGDIETPYIQYDLHYLITSQIILELVFRDGELVNKIDHSATIAGKREQLLSLQRPDFGTSEYEVFKIEIKEWIRSALTYPYLFGDIGWLREIYSRD